MAKSLRLSSVVSARLLLLSLLYRSTSKHAYGVTQMVNRSAIFSRPEMSKNFSLWATNRLGQLNSLTALQLSKSRPST